MLLPCIPLWRLVSVRLATFSELCQTSKMKSITKIANIWKPFIILAKSSIVDAWCGFKYVFGALSCLRILTGKKISNKILAVTKSINMDSWAVGTCNQLLRRGSYKEVLTGKTPFFVIGPFCTSHPICLKIGFWQGSFVWKYCTFNLSTFN